MNQNDSERYRWRTGQRPSGDPSQGYRGPTRKRSSFARAIVAACILLILLLGVRGCRPTATTQVDRHQEVKQ